MKINQTLPIIAMACIILAACSGKDQLSDAYGNFETKEYLIAAEGQGKILRLDAEEGDILEKGALVGLIDTLPLHLKIVQLLAQMESIKARNLSVDAEIAVQESQRETLLIEKDRLKRLLRDEAATEKQMDDLAGQIKVLEQKILSTRTQFRTIRSEILTVKAQLQTIEDQIARQEILNPIKGTVLEKYAEAFEMAMAGKNLYKVADLEEMILRIYISGDQLSGIRLGQQVEVLIDDPLDPKLKGNVNWISDKAEFTPKIIQTREERVNLVYAVKVTVPNDGRLKIGMPGEVNFQSEKP